MLTGRRRVAVGAVGALALAVLAMLAPLPEARDGAPAGPPAPDGPVMPAGQPAAATGRVEPPIAAAAGRPRTPRPVDRVRSGRESVRLGLVPVAAWDLGTEASGFAFYATDDQARPAYWPSCAPLRAALAAGQLTPAGRQRLAEAFTRAASRAFAATGQRIDLLASPAEVVPWVDPDWFASPAAAGVDVLVSAASPDLAPALQGAYAISGASTAVTSDGRLAFTRSGILVDAAIVDGVSWSAFVADGIRGDLVRADEEFLTRVLLHEIGHVLGLGHTPSVGQVMGVRAPVPAQTFQNGDITGIRAAQAAHGCRF